MNFKDLLQPAEEASDVAVIERLRKAELPVVLYGAAKDVAGRIVKKLTASGIAIEAIAFDDDAPLTAAFASFPQGTEAVPVGALDSRFAAYHAVVGFVKGYLQPPSSGRLKNARTVSYLSEIFDMEIISPRFVAENREFLEDFHEHLADQLSKDSFVAYLMSKTRQDMRYLPPVFARSQYFPAGLFDLTGGDESFFDCGAFTGDTVASFLQAAGGRYRRIWAAEPDRANFRLLSQYVESEKLTDVELINKGIYSYAGRLPFREEGTMLSTIAGDSAYCMETDTVDRIVGNEAVTYVKLDVEGAELMALQGAEQTIRAHRPILGISIYHKERDLTDIPSYLKSIAPDYSFYFRVHKKLAIDAVLYATVRDKALKKNESGYERK